MRRGERTKGKVSADRDEWLCRLRTIRPSEENCAMK
jgi:hypothetical protein